MNFRTEISFKNIEQMNKKIQFCNNNKIFKINIPCKGDIKKDFLLEIVEYIGKNHSNLDVVYHYSFNHQYSKNNKISYEYFLEFIEKCAAFRNKEILLVSGSKRRDGFDVIDVLNKLKGEINPKITFGIAYNPYYSDNNHIKEERERLLEKISTGIVNSIWLQLGSNLSFLKKGISFLKNNLNNINYSQNYKIYGSLFVPSKQSLSRFKFRPWKGVFFSNSFLNSVDHANQITQDILKIYSENNIDLLIESECSTNKQLNNTLNILNPN
tara:strand:+ start:13467 stop:14273 length:807 start_codon:yes stop_codon:yes gene_type:complete